jgi:hypothetical protein
MRVSEISTFEVDMFTRITGEISDSYGNEYEHDFSGMLRSVAA